MVRDQLGRPIEYRVAGTGPLLDELRDRARQLGVDDAVDFLGYVPDDAVPALYRWADIFLHPQVDLQNGKDLEGFGLTIADAMSFGCAVIAGRGAGPDDFIEHGRTGLLVDGTQVDEITGAISELASDTNMREEMGNAARTFALAELSWDRHAEKVLAAVDANMSAQPNQARQGVEH